MTTESDYNKHFGPEDNIPRSFNLVKEPDLKNMLTNFNLILPEGDEFTNTDISEAIRDTFTAIDMKRYPISPTSLVERIKTQKMVQFDTKKVGNRYRVVFNREGTYKLAALTWVMSNFFNPNIIIRWNPVRDMTIEMLGEDPMKEDIFTADSDRKFDTEIRERKAQIEEAAKKSLEDEVYEQNKNNARRIADLDTKGDKFWKTSCGEYVKAIFKNPSYADQVEPLTEATIAQLLKFRFADDSVYIKDLADANFFANTKSINKKNYYTSEHFVLTGLFCSYIHEGLLPTEAWVKIRETTKGSNLEEYLGIDPYFSRDFQFTKNVLQDTSPWKSIPFNSQEPPPIPENPVAKGEAHSTTEVKVSRDKQRLNYLMTATSESLDKADDWSTQEFKNKAVLVKNNSDTMSFEHLPIEIAKMVIAIFEVDYDKLRKIDDVIDQFSGRYLWVAGQHITSYLDKYPQFETLGQLIRVKLIGLKKIADNPQKPTQQ